MVLPVTGAEGRLQKPFPFRLGHRSGPGKINKLDRQQLSADMFTIIEYMPIYKCGCRVGRDLIELIKKEVAQAVMNKGLSPDLKCLWLVGLAAADNHRTSIGQGPGISDLVWLGQVCVIFKVLESGDR